MSNREQLEGKVLQWLRKGGFPLELRVARAFAGLGWDVHISQGYTDRVSGKTREIDVVASRRRARKVDDKQYSISLSIVVECKSTSEKPWVGFKSDHNSAARFSGFSLDYSLPSSKALSAISSLGAYLPWPLRASQDCCHGVRQALGAEGENAPNGAWSAVQGVMSATSALEGDEQDGLGRELLKLFHTINIRQPLIIVSGKLYEFSLDEAGMESLQEVGYTDVLLPSRYPIAAQRVPILTEASLPAWVDSFTKSADIVLELALANPRTIDDLLDPPTPSLSVFGLLQPDAAKPATDP